MNKTIDNSSNLSKILVKEHEGKWVAISPDYKKVIGFSEKLSTLEKRVGNQDVIYTKALESNVKYAFCVL